MYLWRKVLLFSFNLLRQRHDVSVLLFIVRSYALWRGRMSEFGPIRNHYHVHLVDHSTRVGCSTFCCATPCWREPTSSKPFCWFSVWSLSLRSAISVAEIWVMKYKIGLNRISLSLFSIFVLTSETFITTLTANHKPLAVMTRLYPARNTRDPYFPSM